MLASPLLENLYEEAYRILMKSWTHWILLVSQVSPNLPLNAQLSVREGGSEVPSAAVVELATRSVTSMKLNGYDWKEAYPHLFFSQTAHHHVLAIHQRGRKFKSENCPLMRSKLSKRRLKAISRDYEMFLTLSRKSFSRMEERDDWA